MVAACLSSHVVLRRSVVKKEGRIFPGCCSLALEPTERWYQTCIHTRYLRAAANDRGETWTNGRRINAHPPVFSVVNATWNWREWGRIPSSRPSSNKWPINAGERPAPKLPFVWHFLEPLGPTVGCPLHSNRQKISCTTASHWTLSR